MSDNKKRYGYFAAVLVFAAALAGLPASAQDGAGGTSGADFLLFPPATRTDAMGGVFDSLEVNLEGLSFNPAALALVPDFRVQLNINPLPNDVTQNQLAVGFPLFGGTAAAAVHMLSTGGFTFINELGQAEASVSVYDAAATLSYARPVWRSIYAGVNLKGVYRTLGDYNGWALAADVGAAARFETPHVGQAPKAPTYEQLEREYEQEQKGIDAENQKRLKPVTEASSALRARIAKLEAERDGLAAKLAETAEDKRPPLQEKKAQVESELRDLSAQLPAAEAAEGEAVAAIESWYAPESAAARERFDAKVADLGWIEAERERLFAVIDDPQAELSAAVIDQNIDASIARTWEFLADRRTALLERKDLFAAKRGTRVGRLREEITGYERQIESEAGPAVNRLSAEIQRLQSDKAALEAAGDEESKARAKELDKEIAARQKEQQGLLSDPWVKRLQGRIDAKNKEIAGIEAEIAAMGEATEQQTQQASARAEKDIQGFESLREDLQAALRKAQLKRELDLLGARRESAADKAQRTYKAKERRVYERLLAAMYGQEEKIFQARLSAAKDDAALRRYDFDTDQQQAREALDNELVFQERFLGRRIAEAKGQGSPEAAALQEDLVGKREAAKAAVAELDRADREFADSEAARLNREVADIRYERRKTRLVFLQTDTPYLNTSGSLSLRNAGTPITFVSEAYPMPMTLSVALGYAVVNTQLHNLKLTTQFDVPLYDPETIAGLISLGAGVEYVFANLAYLRGGYTFLGAGDRSFAAGFGVRLAAGFTEYSVDYAFRPLTDYGFLHSFGVSIAF